MTDDGDDGGIGNYEAVNEFIQLLGFIEKHPDYYRDGPARFSWGRLL